MNTYNINFKRFEPYENFDEFHDRNFVYSRPFQFGWKDRYVLFINEKLKSYDGVIHIENKSTVDEEWYLTFLSDEDEIRFILEWS